MARNIITCDPQTVQGSPVSSPPAPCYPRLAEFEDHSSMYTDAPVPQTSLLEYLRMSALPTDSMTKGSGASVDIPERYAEVHSKSAIHG